MADIRLLVMRLFGLRNIDAKIMRRLGLTAAGDVVLFAFYGQKRCSGDF